MGRFDGERTPGMKLLIAILIKLDSPGPVLFRQLRCGLHGRPFTFLKFRSMRVLRVETASKVLEYTILSADCQISA